MISLDGLHVISTEMTKQVGIVFMMDCFILCLKPDMVRLQAEKRGALIYLKGGLDEEGRASWC